MKQYIDLYINGQKVEFSTPPDILYNYKITDLTNPTIVKNSFSKSVTIEGTPNNNDLFGHIWNVQRVQSDVTYNASKKAPFELYINGTIYESGYVRLYEARLTNKGIEYDITLFGGLGDFFYNLSYTSDGEERNLASLHYMTGDTSVSSENEFDFEVNKENIYDAWITTGPDSTGNTKWKYINFCPSYNGVPDNDFDADKVLINFNESPLPQAVQNKEDNDYYYLSQNGWSIGTAASDMTEWEARDIRSYLQRPCIRVKEIINACCNPENNGGYTVNLDSDFFNSNNPYWEDSWLTLPMISDMEFSDTEEVYTDATLICSDSQGELPEQYSIFTFQTGTFSQEPMGRVSVTGKVLAKTYTNDGAPDLYTAYARLSSNGNRIKSIYNGALLCQLVAYNGDNVVGVSGVQRLYSRIWNDKQGEYIMMETPRTASSVTNTISSGGNTTNRFGHFKLQSGNIYYWKPESGGDTLTFNINSVNTNITSLKMRFLWEANDDILEDYNYGALFTAQKHYGLGSDSNFGMRSVSACSMTVTDKNFGAVVGSAIKSGARLTKGVLLGNSAKPADYLIGFAKMFGLYFLKDLNENKIEILTRNNFYNNPNYEDLTERIDREKGYQINPLSFDAKWYDFELDMDDTQFAKKYENAYKVKFGMQAVNTGYDFDANRNGLLENVCYKGAVECLEKSKYFVTLAQDNYYKGYMLMGFTYKLWWEGKEMDAPITGVTYGSGSGRPLNSLFALNEDANMKYYDVFPKLQFHDNSNKSTDGSNVMVFFNGYKDVVSGRTRPLYYYLTDDLAYMNILNNNSCWLYTNSEYDTEGNRIAYRITKFPVFERYETNENSGFITKSMDFGSPREMYIPTYTHLQDATIYDYFWKNYISDLYDINDRVLDCYVKLKEKPNPDFLRRFFWFDNCIWRLNEVIDWNIGSDDLVHMQFVKVQDTNNYTSVQPAKAKKITLELSKYMVDASGETITGTITCPSGYTWHVEWPSAISVSPITGTGNGTITIVIPANTTEEQKAFPISVVATGMQAKQVVYQHYEGEGAFTLSPRDLVVPYSGGTYMLDISWNDKGLNTISTAVTGANVIGYSADVTTYALTNQIEITIPAYTGNTILNDYATFSVSGDSSLTYTLGICQLPEVMEFPYSGSTTAQPFTYLHECELTQKPFWVISGSFSGGNINLTVNANPNDTRDGLVEVTGDGTSATMTFVQLSSGSNGLLDPEVLNYPASGGALTFDIKTDGAWQIVGKPSWITLSSTAGTGTTTITATGAENTTAQERTNSIAVYFPELNNTFPVITNQEAGEGSNIIDPMVLNYEYTGGTQSITINIPGAWQVVGRPDWVTLSQTGGTGATVLSVTVGENTGDTRSGYIVIYDSANNTTYAVLVTQDGSLAAIIVNPSYIEIPASGGTYPVEVFYKLRGTDTATINTNGDSAITYAPSVLTWTSEDTAQLSVTITANNTNTAAVHRITYSGVSKNVSAVQVFYQRSGSYATPDSDELIFDQTGGTLTDGITSNIAWTATSDSNWFTFSPTSGDSGYTVITVTVTGANNTFITREGHIYIRTIGTDELLATITVKQTGKEEILDVNPIMIVFDATGGTATFTITSNTSWTIEEI